MFGASGVVCVDEALNKETLGNRYFPIYSSFQIEARAMRDGLMTLSPSLAYENSRVNVFTDSKSLITHLVALSKKRRLVSKEVLELIDVIKDLVIGKDVQLSLYWIPGHVGIGYNDLADSIARTCVMAKGRNYTELSIPRSRVRTVNRVLEREAFKRYLKGVGSDSHWDNYPPRKFFTTTRVYDESNNRCTDIGVFRIRTGHNRLKSHLFNIGLEESPKCRFCEDQNEDCYHFLAECEEILKTKAGGTILEIRMTEGPFSRSEFHDWLFHGTDGITHQRKKFIKALNAAGVDL